MAGPPSPEKPCIPLPATTVRRPAGEIFTTCWLPRSATYTFPASFVTDKFLIDIDGDGNTGAAVTSVVGGLALDGGGYLAYLAPTRANLQLTQERWPDVDFVKTREH